MHHHARTFALAAGASLALFGVAMAATPPEVDAFKIAGKVGTVTVSQRPRETRQTRVEEEQVMRYDRTVAPLAHIVVERPFGPYGDASGAFAGFNLGVDLGSRPGETVRALADGDVQMIAGTVAIVRHVADIDVPNAARATRRWYSLYAPVVVDPTIAEGASIGMGDAIGTVPMGASVLHLETFLRTATGDDRAGAAISPMRFLPMASRSAMAAKVVSRSPLRIEVTVDAATPLLDEIRVRADGRTYAVAFDRRTGFTRASDGTFVPAEARIDVTASADGAALIYGFTFEELSDFESILVRDIWGRGLALDPSDVSQ